MEVRATYQSRVSNLVNSLRHSTARQAKLQQSISSGIRIPKPSDAPTQFIAAQNALTASDRLAAYLDTTSSATNDLNAGVSALQEATSILNSANVIALQAVNDPADSSELEALASQVDQLISRMLRAANSELDGRSLFAGSATDQTAYTVTATDASGRPTAITYQGDSSRAKMVIGAGETTDVRYAGSEIFRTGSGGDVFQTLMGLRDDLRNPSLTSPARAQLLNARLTQIKVGRDSVLGAVGEQSAALESLDAVQNHMRDLQLSLQIRAGDLQGTDYAEAIAKLSEEQTIYEATLAMTAKVFGPTLLDYLQ